MGEEIWKKVNGFKNYEVSNMGRVRNVNNVFMNIDKYSLITLYDEIKRRRITLYKIS